MMVLLIIAALTKTFVVKCISELYGAQCKSASNDVQVVKHFYLDIDWFILWTVIFDWAESYGKGVV